MKYEAVHLIWIITEMALNFLPADGFYSATLQKKAFRHILDR